MAAAAAAEMGRCDDDITGHIYSQGGGGTRFALKLVGRKENVLHLEKKNIDVLILQRKWHIWLMIHDWPRMIIIGGDGRTCRSGRRCCW